MDRELAVPLVEALDETAFGGKAVSLGAAIRAGLPVPPGLAMGTTLVERVAADHGVAAGALLASPHLPAARLAVRSSAVGEDSAGASFAGQHVTRLNVYRVQLLDAVRDVWGSAHTESARAYRERKGLPGQARIGVVVQQLVEPIAAGVLFTRNPMTGADERVIEAAWGLGEAVVSGTVVPDRFTLDASGRVVEIVPGDKDVKIWYGDADGTIEVPVPPELREAPCLTEEQLGALHDLAERCRRVWGPNLDLEWALGEEGTMYLLQCRPITTLSPHS
jgi:pyruvate,water dikinase